ncbi:uncharacterized protein PRCAT00005549001 [Priceomyces carsonii]|uniref:uncharacterized protein n=1 Tax=Priceomyces carsonii TaxID=28549 RepID=UPI002ED82F26|nr:unnamed protein product [Priceomyces carsonii]
MSDVYGTSSRKEQQTNSYESKAMKEICSRLFQLNSQFIAVQNHNNQKLEEISLKLEYLSESVENIKNTLGTMSCRLKLDNDNVQQNKPGSGLSMIFDVINRHLLSMSKDMEALTNTNVPTMRIHEGYINPSYNQSIKLSDKSVAFKPVESTNTKFAVPLHIPDSLTYNHNDEGAIDDTFRGDTGSLSISSLPQSKRFKPSSKTDDKALSDAIDVFPNGDLNRTVEESTPQYKLEKSLKTIDEIWKEYEYGLNGKPPLKDLENKFGTKWRNETELRTFLRRKKIYEAIEIGKALGNSDDDVIRELEAHRSYDHNGYTRKKPLLWLCQNVPSKFSN